MVYDFGLTLRNLRKKNKLTQSQVAKRLNLTKASISGYENNINSPSIDVLRQLAYLYGVSSDYLLGIDKKEVIVIDGLTARQKELLNLMITEFKSGKQNR